ncbi:MFS transporter [Geothrix sp. SG200]|uniref:MFS transporter n=1 Tax=Geothrix sp. SG200 TaxID=2922865 RepID=UPI001FAD8ADB|nr:MFS transporter [Geothrix sp. SG200]
MSERSRAATALAMSTLAFTLCFAVWTLNGVLVTFLVENGLFRWDTAQIGWLIGIPVLTGSVMRLPVGLLTDRFGGRKVYAILLLLAALPTWLLGSVQSYQGFLLASLGFGLSGAAFAVGIAYSSVWFSKERQGTALGIFGAGNAGSALTSMGAPFLLKKLTAGGANLEAWRMLPKLYAIALLIMAAAFFLLTHEKKAEGAKGKTFVQMLAPLRHLRVWRFGLYYFLVFGCFVALAQWLIPYYVGVYGMSLAMAGLLASLFSLPSGLIRAAGGWMSDRFGARAVMYWTFGLSIVACAALMVPRMSIESPGPSVLAQVGGVVTEVAPGRILVGDTPYAFRTKEAAPDAQDGGMLVLPQSRFWQTPVVKVGDRVKKKQLLASGTTHVFFQANVWIFTFLVFVVGIVWGIGKAAVYRYIPDYFPDEVGVVGGIVGVIGGLGGFVGPILFGYLLKATGLWTTMWLFLAVLSVVCLVWLHTVVRRLTREQNETLFTRFERPASALAETGAPEPA